MTERWACLNHARGICGQVTYNVIQSTELDPIVKWKDVIFSDDKLWGQCKHTGFQLA